ncbi:SH3 domain-containing protein [Roseibium marinum]|uniref:SH3 domain-containing protein n=1 Tax=Roseibium marinum TaxID=281252 RepID=A0A2S3UMV2_9HYPH|nr:SH3 domain-containing protein [Roseibium marinum]POF29025.1 SH3 domain-containing protein [Roseibium marinum]
MYSFSAPATACDPFPDNSADTANLPATKSDLRLVEIRKPATDGPQADEGSSPHGLAEKILQMHAMADGPDPEETRRPKLVSSEKEAALEIPRVFQRTNKSDTPPELDHVTAGSAKSGHPSSEPVRHGPGFRALIASTLVIIACGGGALALAMTGLLGNSESSSKEIAAQLTAAETTIERLIEEAAPDPGSSTPDLAATELAGTADANGLQIARAKDKLREAFAAQGLTAATPLNSATAVDTNAAGSPEGKIQARLDLRQISVPAAAAESATQDLPVLAAPANAVPVNSAQTSASEAGPAVGATQAMSVQEVSEADGNAAAAVTGETRNADPSFPNSGKIAAAVNLRQSADKNAEILAVIPAGADVRFGDCGAWWCGIQFEGQTGYVGQKFLEKAPQVD